MEEGQLLFPVAALLVEATAKPLWYRRAPGAHASVISDYSDVPDLLGRVPECWNVVPGARVEGLHDDEDIVAADPRFNGAMGDRGFVVIRHTDRLLCVALLLINAAEAVLLPKRLLGPRDTLERCVPGLDRVGG